MRGAGVFLEAGNRLKGKTMAGRGRLGHFAALTLAVLPGMAGAASFDCAKARMPDELLICGDPGLSRADERMSDSYRALMDGVQAQALGDAVRDRLRAEQRAWVGRRNKRCGLTASTKLDPANRAHLAECLREEVEERIARLDRLRAGVPISVLAEPQRITETSKAKNYRVEVAYPALPATVAGADVLNALAERRVRPIVRQFLDEAATDPDPGVETMSALDIGYEVTFASPRLVSVQFDVYSYAAGAAHGNSITHSLHVDLDRRREVTAADVFLPGGGWEKILAEHALADLTRQAKERESELLDGADRDIPAVVADLTNWRLEGDRAFIRFDPYAVSAYALGRLEVPVPYALLKPYLKPDGPLPPKRS